MQLVISTNYRKKSVEFHRTATSRVPVKKKRGSFINAKASRWNWNCEISAHCQTNKKRAKNTCFTFTQILNYQSWVKVIRLREKWGDENSRNFDAFQCRPNNENIQPRQARQISEPIKLWRESSTCSENISDVIEM